MKIEFYKYHGTGNDFVMIDNRKQFIPKDISVIQHLCDRHFGIGSDGLIFIESDEATDFIMDFYNPDGSQSFCGNGSRCAVAFAAFLGIIQDQARFKAIDGEHKAIIKDQFVKVKMHDPQTFQRTGDHYFIHTGSPHYIAFTNNLDNEDIISFGRQIRYSELYKEEGTNVNLVEKTSDGIKMRTYERGVENETLSCGTGVTAAALSALDQGWFKNKVQVSAPGGELTVQADRNDKNFHDIWLGGTVVQVFKGKIDV